MEAFVLGRSRSTAVHRARRSGGLALVAVLAMVAAGCTDWTQRLGNDRHTTQNGSTAIAAGNATSLVEKWRMQPPACSNGVGVNVTGAVWFATPVTYKGVIYIGDDFGCLNAINEQTGAIIWRRYFNFLTYKTCQQRLGWVSSVNLKVENGVPVLYAYAPDNYAYKLRASDGSTIWRVLVQAESASTNDVYAWSSPTVVNGKVIIGVSSNCDTPFIQGKVHAFRASDGAWLWTHNTVPNGYVGAGDWYDAAVDEDGNVYVTTGSTYDDIAATHPNTTPGFEYYSLLKLNGDTGALIWKAPAPAYLNDPDYATSPILFEGGGLELVGAFNKDGWFRVYRRDNGKEVWQAKVGSQDMSEADHALAGGGIFDGTRLFVVSNVTKVGGGWNNIFPGAWQPSSTGLSVPGSIRELNPATGALVSEGGHPWEIGVAADIMGPCAINANDIVACAGGQLQNADINNGHQNGVYLFDTHSAPRILAHLEDRNSVGNTQDYGEFSEPIFEGNSIIATNNFYMTKWSLP
jgi:outer membrane protein assembly factor BamB